MITRKKVTEAFTEMLKNYDDTFYGRTNLVQSIVSDPLQFDKARTNNINAVCVYFWIDETVPDVIASQNHFEIYLMDCIINVKYSSRNNGIAIADEIYEYIKKYTLEKEYNGLVLSEYYTDTNSNIISMTPIESTLPPPVENEKNELTIILESAIEFNINIW